MAQVPWVAVLSALGGTGGCRQCLGSLVDGTADAGVGRAAADVAAHGRVDVRIARLRVRGQQRGRRHDLAALTVATLRHVEPDPGRLHRLAGRRAQTLDGGYLFALNGGYRRHARAHGGAVDVHRAGAAQRHAAAELGAGELQVIAERPQQRHVRRDVELVRIAVDGELGRHRLTPWSGKGKRYAFFARIAPVRHTPFEVRGTES